MIPAVEAHVSWWSLDTRQLTDVLGPPARGHHGAQVVPVCVSAIRTAVSDYYWGEGGASVTLWNTHVYTDSRSSATAAIATIQSHTRTFDAHAHTTNTTSTTTNTTAAALLTGTHSAAKRTGTVCMAGI